MPLTAKGDQVGFVALVRENADVRRLWFGNSISLLGDWFNTIALYELVERLTGSPFALGAVFIAKQLPWALASPFAGVLVDRIDRRTLMIGSDLIRAVIVLGFLFVGEASDVYLVYLLTALQVMLGSVFQPALNASLPNITSPRELVTANALMSATWSVLLAFGAALGGFATDWLGARAVFILDSLTYLVSAYFIFRMRIPHALEAPGPGSVLEVARRKMVEGFRHIAAVPRIGRLVFAKAAWSMGGGALVYMLTLVGQEISPAAPAVGIGILYAARGVGTGIGPIAARVLFTNPRAWPAIIGWAVLVSGVAYTLLGLQAWTWFIAGFIVLAHAASGANWMLATVLLQQRTADRFRGRVFATEWLVIMLVEALSILVASTLLEGGYLTLRSAVVTFAVVQILSGLLWLTTVVPREAMENEQ